MIDDGIVFEIKDVETIMDEMEYPGIRIHLNAVMDMICHSNAHLFALFR